MNHFKPSPMLLQVVNAGLMLALISCSASDSSLKQKHPNLTLKPRKISSDRLISDLELKSCRRVQASARDLSFVMVKGLVVAVATVATVCAVPYSDLFGSEETGAHSPTFSLSVQKHPRIQLFGDDIKYRPSNSDGDVQLALSKGTARIEISDQHGSYYCRADEIHYRQSTNEIFLRGNASVSATYAPGIHDFGLVRIDLDHCVAEYGGSQSKSSP